MPTDDDLKFFYSDGTATFTNASDQVVGQFTVWNSALLPLDFITDGAHIGIIKSIEDATHLTLSVPWGGATGSAVAYTGVRWVEHTDPRRFGIRVSEYLTKLRQVPSDIEAFVVSIDAAIESMSTYANTASGAATTATSAMEDAVEAAEAAEDDRQDTADLKADVETIATTTMGYRDAAQGYATAAAASAAILANPDYGFITDVPTDTADYGGLV